VNSQEKVTSAPATRRAIAEKIEKSPEIDVVCLPEGSVLVVQVKSARQELDQDLERLQHAEEMIVSDPDIMRGSPVYRETRIPVQLVADMLNQGATPEEIVEGYPSLDKEKVALAPFYVQAFPSRGRPVARSWAKDEASSDNPPSPFSCRVTMKFLIDECLHTSLMQVAHTAGYAADHVN
jgi:uncharacterized protein (DUF433 family)